MLNPRFTRRVPRYRVDLSLSEPVRWTPVLRREARRARALVRAALSPLSPAVRALTAPSLWGFYRAFGGRWTEELRAWAGALDLSPAEVCLANCLYEAAQGAEWLGHGGAALACTAAARWVPGRGMVHVRSLDWPLTGLGRATRVFDFVGGPQRYLTVGVPGFVGALSGLVPGAFSVSLNWAPPAERPGRGWGPAFLLRWVLETCPTWASAVRALRDAPLAVPALFLVCGTRAGEAAAVERTRTRASVRSPVAHEPLAQANHYVSRGMRPRNTHLAGGAADALAASHTREALLATRLQRLAPHVLATDARMTLRHHPVQNADTQQQLVLVPRTGQLWAWARR